jgi:L-malate glycosyltransferase
MSERWPVLLLVRTLDFGGSERQCVVTATALDRTRFEPYIGVFHKEGFRVKDAERTGVPVIRFPVRSFGSKSAVDGAREMIRFMREKRIGLVHAFDVPMDLFGVPVAWAARRPIVLSSTRAHRQLTPGIRRWVLRLSDRMADGIVVNCEAMREHLIRDEGVPRERTRLCYNGIDLEIFHHRRPEAKPAEFQDSLVIGVVCGLREEKGLDTLVAAYALAARELSNARLVLVGDGVCREGLEAQAKRLGIRERTIFLPARAEVASLLRGMDIFVLPSRSEALSNALMEAMACGCCAVASTAGGNPELVEHERTGLQFRVDDVEGLATQLRRLIEDPALRTRLAAEGQRFIESRFSQEASALRMQEIYTEYLSGRSG